jgi:hypothetical protein
MQNIIKKKGRSNNDPAPVQFKPQLGEEFYINLTNRLTIIIMFVLIMACIGFGITLILSPKEEGLEYLKDVLKILGLVGSSFIAGFGWGYKFKKY